VSRPGVTEEPRVFFQGSSVLSPSEECNWVACIYASATLQALPHLSMLCRWASIAGGPQLRRGISSFDVLTKLSLTQRVGSRITVQHYVGKISSVGIGPLLISISY
jgi:hypothetical protein